MSDNNIRIFSDPFNTARGFAHYFFELVSKAATFSVALSGGSTPKIMFDYFAKNHARSEVWQKIHFYWGDERCVPPESNDSNFKMTKEHLLDKIDIPDENIHRISGENVPENESVRYSGLLLKNLPVKNKLPVFDLIILGMGDDGHTASIFPGQINLLESQKICAVAEHPVSGQKRITLTGKVINNAKGIVFLITGENKKEKVYQILNNSGDWKKYPASYIKPDHGKISWFLDKASASLL